MSNHPRPLLLGYIRADVLTSGTDLPRAEAELEAFADREEFSLGTVYVESGSTPGAFHALISEVNRNEDASGVVVPDLRHLTVVEQLVMTTHHHYRPETAILAASPRSGGPDASPPCAPGLPFHHADV